MWFPTIHLRVKSAKHENILTNFDIYIQTCVDVGMPIFLWSFL